MLITGERDTREKISYERGKGLRNYIDNRDKGIKSLALLALHQKINKWETAITR